MEIVDQKILDRSVLSYWHLFKRAEGRAIAVALDDISRQMDYQPLITGLSVIDQWLEAIKNAPSQYEAHSLNHRAMLISALSSDEIRDWKFGQLVTAIESFAAGYHLSKINKQPDPVGLFDLSHRQELHDWINAT